MLHTEIKIRDLYRVLNEFKKGYKPGNNLVKGENGKEALYNILMEFGIPIKMCLNETYSRVCIGEHLSDSFPIQNGLNQGVAESIER
jgi:hypothetical protein